MHHFRFVAWCEKKWSFELMLIRVSRQTPIDLARRIAVKATVYAWCGLQTYLEKMLRRSEIGEGVLTTHSLFIASRNRVAHYTISILGWPIELETTLNTIWTLLTGQSKHVNHMHVAYVSFQSVWIVAVGGVFVVWRNRNVKVLKRRDSVLERTRHFRIDISSVQPPVCHLALTILASIAKHLVTLGMFLNSVRSSSLKM